jgi:hypothetical protein
LNRIVLISLFDNSEEIELGDEYDSTDSDMETSEFEGENADRKSDESRAELRKSKDTAGPSSHTPDPDLVSLQKVDVFLQQLPYFDKIKANGFASFSDIKKNLSESLVLNEIRPGFLHWTNRLIVFIHEFGLFFGKEDHIKLIKLFLSVVETPDIDLSTVDFCFNALTELLKYFFFQKFKYIMLKDN